MSGQKDDEPNKRSAESAESPLLCERVRLRTLVGEDVVEQLVDGEGDVIVRRPRGLRQQLLQPLPPETHPTHNP